MNFLIFPMTENNAWLDWLNFGASLGVAIGTIALAWIGVQAKNAWVEERRLEVFESLFNALSHVINWLNDFYDFTINPKLYQGMRSQEASFIDLSPNKKKNYIINSIEIAFNELLKINLAKYRLFINVETGKKLRNYYEELKKIFEELKKGNLPVDSNGKKSSYLERLEFDKENELQALIDSIRKDLGIK